VGDVIRIVIFSLFGLALPLILLPVFVRGNQLLTRFGFVCFFFVPLVGEIVYMGPVISESTASATEFWLAVLGFYPMALVPWGLWGAVLGVAGARFLHTLQSRYRIAFRALLACGLLSGAVTGLAFVIVMVAAAAFTGSITEVSGTAAPFAEALRAYALAGAVAGAFGGLIAAYYAGEADMA
jgi:hypothetical protein